MRSAFRVCDLFFSGGTQAPKRKHNYNRHCLS
nr:MAG TPA_asm: hypothetical protein [Bacteriophage sp.]